MRIRTFEAALAVGLATLFPRSASATHCGPDDAGCDPPPMDPGPGNAVEALAGCTANTLARNDDQSTTSPVALGFTANFYGAVHSDAWVNNNGNITFDAPQSTYTPFNLYTTSRKIVAPFFADVDTRDLGSAEVTYGQTTFGGHLAFCVNWSGVGVGYYYQHSDKLNNFQLLIVERPDVAAGDFDIIFNYNQIQWESGDASGGTGGLGGQAARAGYSNGVNVTSLELTGSGVPGSFLDSNPSGLIYGSRGTTRPGRYIFEVRNSGAPIGATISGRITDPNAMNAVNAPVQACTTGNTCLLTQTNGSGLYGITGLADGDWTVQAFPPAGTEWLSVTSAPVTITGGADQTVNLTLGAPMGIPPGTTLGPSWKNGTVTNINWHDVITLTTEACTGGTASFAFTLDSGPVIASGPMTEGPIGTYTATFGPVYPEHGDATVSFSITCPDSSVTTGSFDIYIDPQGTVRTMAGDPIEGATVALFRSDAESGPFTQVPQGSAIMSPNNRNNPVVTDETGRFGWDVVTGYYIVTAEKAGCTSPDGDHDHGQTPVLHIPPPATDIDLRLKCDFVAPVLTLPGDITVEATSASGSVVSYEASAHDDVEGEIPIECTPESGSLFALGSTAVSCEASDSSNNATQGGFSVSVVYGFGGVQQPINADGSSVFKLGKTVPVKFSLTGASSAIGDAVARLYLAKVSNNVVGTEIEATTTVAASTGNLFRYDSASSQYIFNLSTSSLSKGTWQLTLDLGDGIDHTVLISLQ